MKINRLEFNPEELPEVIYNSFISLMEKEPNKIDFVHVYPFSLQKESIEGDQIYTYYLFIKDWNLFINRMRNKELRDENDELIGLRASESYVLSYAKGFSKGYSEFVPSIKGNELFDIDVTNFWYKVFSRVWKIKNINKGSINVENGKFKDYENLDSFFYYIDTDLMFQQGIKGGEYYKAWEIILSNPLKFEIFFSDYSIKELTTNKLKINEPEPTQSKPIQPEPKELKYKYDTALIGKTYDLSKSDNIFTCTDIGFMECVGAANFSTITINKKAKMKWLIKTLSKKMGANWYYEAARSVGYIDEDGYNDCSRATVPDTDIWTKSIKKLLSD
jgi:hypothetical protein